jgi:hypothetical protein
MLKETIEDALAPLDVFIYDSTMTATQLDPVSTPPHDEPTSLTFSGSEYSHVETSIQPLPESTIATSVAFTPPEPTLLLQPVDFPDANEVSTSGSYTAPSASIEPTAVDTLIESSMIVDTTLSPTLSPMTIASPSSSSIAYVSIFDTHPSPIESPMLTDSLLAVESQHVSTSFNMYVPGLNVGALAVGSFGSGRKLFMTNSDFTAFLPVLFSCMQQSVAHIQKAQFTYANMCWTSMTGAYIAVTSSSANNRIPAWFASPNVTIGVAACVCRSFRTLAMTCVVASPPPYGPPPPASLTFNPTGASAKSAAASKAGGASSKSMIGIGCGAGIAIAFAAFIVIRRHRRRRLEHPNGALVESENVVSISTMNALSAFSDSHAFENQSTTNPLFRNAPNRDLDPMPEYDALPFDEEGIEEEDEVHFIEDVPFQETIRLHSASFCDMLKSVVLSDETTQTANNILGLFEAIAAPSGVATREVMVEQLTLEMEVLGNKMHCEQGGHMILKEMQQQMRTILHNAPGVKKQHDAHADILRVMARLRRVRRNSLYEAATTSVTTRARLRWNVLRNAYWENKLVHIM